MKNLTAINPLFWKEKLFFSHTCSGKKKLFFSHTTLPTTSENWNIILCFLKFLSYFTVFYTGLILQVIHSFSGAKPQTSLEDVLSLLNKTTLLELVLHTSISVSQETRNPKAQLVLLQNHNILLQTSLSTLSTYTLNVTRIPSTGSSETCYLSSRGWKGQKSQQILLLWCSQLHKTLALLHNL